MGMGNRGELVTTGGAKGPPRRRGRHTKNQIKVAPTNNSAVGTGERRARTAIIGMHYRE